jgi:hypothetical protein
LRMLKTPDLARVNSLIHCSLPWLMMDDCNDFKRQKKD